MTQLLQVTRRQSFHDSGSVRIRQAEWDGLNVHLDLVVKLADKGPSQVWTMTALDACSTRIEEPQLEGKRVELVSRHPLIDSEVGPFSELRFRGVPDHFESLMIDLWNRHHQLAGHWILLDDFFSSNMPLPELLRSGEGGATGPTTLLSAYATVLRAHGLSVELVKEERRKPYYWRGAWFPRRPSVGLCFINGSYLIAARFTAERL